MEAQEIHRGRLFDHVQLVVRDLAASQAFYTAVLEALQVPMGGADEGYFWADELFVSSADSPAAQGHLTGRHHLAFQARDRAMVDAFYQAALAHGGTDNGAPGERRACSKSFWRSHWSAIGMSGCSGCAAWARAHASSWGVQSPDFTPTLRASALPGGLRRCGACR